MVHAEKKLPKEVWPGWAFTRGMCVFNFLIGGAYFGMSPLIIPVTAAFNTEVDGDYSGGIFFYGFAVMSLVNNFTSCVGCFVIVNASPWRKFLFVSCGLVAWPIALAALVLSVQYKLLPLLFGVAFPLMGFTIGVVVCYLQLVEMVHWWGEDINKGHSLTGGCSAVGALFSTWGFGELLHGLGHDNVVVALWIYCGVHATGVILGLLMFNPARHMRIANSEDKAIKGTPLSELAKDWRVYVFIFVCWSFFFAGMSMKTLLSVLFEELFEMSYIEAVRYSAGCLSFYVVARVAAPLLSAGDYVFNQFLIVLVLEGLAYLCTPWVVHLDDIGHILYTLFRLVSGAGFAILCAITGVFIVRVFGTANVASISGLFLSIEWIACLGPSVAFFLHVGDMENGKERTQSWNSFFYLCAAVVFSAALGVFALKTASEARKSSTTKVIEVVPRDKEIAGA
eukprot:gnl/MRDRNA2_/MRDRNA2_57700_c0_seq1.p1 gnl/MRDRNA2_/MRDRNA2_57700_c0~~gnl/MRDRNA2_/MRDRNA2_57700_c0_seq1.p1  ORF type:complete len:452 (+),score=48.82 gnl/MRDRNA2_/MRDRNA2_57700_c0_seq1:55-1410(+)